MFSLPFSLPIQDLPCNEENLRQKAMDSLGCASKSFLHSPDKPLPQVQTLTAHAHWKGKPMIGVYEEPAMGLGSYAQGILVV